jgi:hypothetical protein
MARYYRQSKKGAQLNEYYAVSASDDNIAGSAYGRVHVDHTPGFMGPIWDNGDESRRQRPTNALSDATGVSHELIKHIVKHGDDNMEYDEWDNLSNIVNWGDTHRTNPEGFKKAVETIKNHPMVNTGMLFGDTKGKVEITGAYFDRHATNLFPTTVSIIKQDYPNSDIVPSDNLSSHSSKVVQNALSRGLISPNERTNPEGNATNNIDFETKIVTPFEAKHMETYIKGSIPQEEVNLAQKNLRETLKRSRVSKMSPQFSRGEMHDEVRANTQSFKFPEEWNSPHKPKLPGLENY